MTPKIARVEWKCPSCGTDSAGCKRGSNERLECRERGGSGCSGFICECTEPGSADQDHGSTYGRPCEEARCYHCNWTGRFPKAPSKTKPWEEKALAAGWQPPRGWPHT